MASEVINLSGKYISAKEFAKRMGWHGATAVYHAIAAGRVPGCVRTPGGEWLIPASAVAIDKRRFKQPDDPRGKEIRQYLFVNDGVQLWAERGWVYLYDSVTMIKEPDNSENRARLLEIARG